MNVALPQFPGGDAAQFWWMAGAMAAMTAVMLLVFRIRRLDLMRGKDHAAAARSRQPDCRGRSGRAAGVGRQGAGRERDRRRRARGSRFTIEFGGKKQIRVEDDGEGMEPDDARLAIERHATSKIRRADDLARDPDARLPRRGAAVDRLGVALSCCAPAPRGRTSGTEIRVNGGAIAGVRRGRGVAEGTVVEVNDLFYNLPARRKFLKADGAESAQVSRIVTQLRWRIPRSASR